MRLARRLPTPYQTAGVAGAAACRRLKTKAGLDGAAVLVLLAPLYPGVCDSGGLCGGPRPEDSR